MRLGGPIDAAWAPRVACEKTVGRTLAVGFARGARIIIEKGAVMEERRSITTGGGVDADLDRGAVYDIPKRQKRNISSIPISIYINI